VSYVEATDANCASWIARCDPRLKLVWLGAISLAAVLVDSTAALVALFAATLVVAISAGWTPRTWLVVGGILLAAAWGTVLSQAMFYPASPRMPLVTFVPAFTVGRVQFPGLALYREGAAYGLLQSLRMLSGILAGLSVCLSTSPERLLAAAASLRVPSAVSYMTVTALRFLPTMIEQWQTVRNSCRLRGYGRGAYGRRRWSSLGTEAALCVPVVAAALRRAATLATSLTARGFDATQPRTTYPPLAMTRLERAVVVLLAASAAILSALKTLYWMTEGRLDSMPRLEALNELVRDWL
jgi:energy-coupling factor transport system permease protein